MKYFTRKEILENLKVIIEGMDESKHDVNVEDVNNPNCAGIVYANQFVHGNDYINDEIEARKAIEEYLVETSKPDKHYSPFELEDALREKSYFYGNEWNACREATELEIALALTVQLELFPRKQRKTLTKQIALDKINKELQDTKDDEIVVFKG